MRETIKAHLDSLVSAGTSEVAYQYRTIILQMVDKIIAERDAVKTDANTLAEMLSDSLNNDEPRTAPEDIEIEALCLRLGFGAVLSSAARLWARRDDNAAFTLGSCRALIRSALANHEIAKGDEE